MVTVWSLLYAQPLWIYARIDLDGLADLGTHKHAHNDNEESSCAIKA